MKRAKQGLTASPRELLCVSKDNKLQAKKTALALVEKSINSHILSSADNHNILRALCSAMALPETEITKLRKPRTHSSTESSANTTKKGGRSNSIDDHDEICEVCEKGGDLLCCDTCTLVFHLKCIRPKLSVVPKGHWSCPHCIIDDLADGDICAAKRSIRSMTRLARGIDSDDDSGFTATGGPEAADPMRVSRLGEYSIVRKGKKFVLRKAERKQLVDIGKYLSLEEAMNYIKEEQFNAQQEAEKSAAVEAAKKTSKRSLPHSSSTSSLQKRRRGNDADAVEDAQGAELDDEGRRAIEEGVSPRRSVSDSSMSVAPEASSTANSQGQDGSSTTNSYDELWCTHCLDDKGVTICAFCGCKKCYGKYDSSLLILCDYCDRETHTYCLDPPLSAVPEEDPWYCQSCTADGVPDNVSDGDGEGEGSEVQGYDESGSEGDSEAGRRGVGRPRLNRSGSYSSTTSMVDSQGSFDEPNDGTVIYKKWGRGFKKIVAGSATKSSDDGKRGKYQTKALLAAAAAAQQLHHQQAAPKHRGRGRPPGSGKRIIPTTTGLLGSTSTLLSDYAVRPALKFGEPRRKASISSSMSGASTSSTAALAAAATAEYKLKSKLQAKSYLSGGWDADQQAADDNQDYTLGQDSAADSQDEDAPGSVGEEESTPDPVEEAFELGAPGVASVLKIIARASNIRGKVDNGPWTDAELDQLDYVRGWGPTQDLNRVLAALLEQKEILVKKILAAEPGFVCKDLENSIVAQIAEARAAAAALAATALISDSLSAGAPSVASGPIATTAARSTGTAKSQRTPGGGTGAPRWKKPKTGVATSASTATGAAAGGKPTTTPGTGKKSAGAATVAMAGVASTSAAAIPAGATATVPPLTSPAAAMTANLTQKVGTPTAAVNPRPLPAVAIPAGNSAENIYSGVVPPLPAPIL